MAPGLPHLEERACGRGQHCRTPIWASGPLLWDPGTVLPLESMAGGLPLLPLQLQVSGPVAP